jgi:hypothetical protein
VSTSVTGRANSNRARSIGPVLAAALEGRAIDLRERHAEERRGAIGPVVDLLGEQALGCPLAPDDRHRFHVEEEAGGAAVFARVRVEYVRLAEAQVLALEWLGVLVQAIAEIGARAVRGREGEQHRVRLKSLR